MTRGASPRFGGGQWISSCRAPVNPLSQDLSSVGVALDERILSLAFATPPPLFCSRNQISGVVYTGYADRASLTNR